MKAGGTTRRDLLKLLAALTAGNLLGARKASAYVGRSYFHWSQLRYGGSWNPHPRAASRMLSHIIRRTSVECDVEATSVSLTDMDLFERPFLFVTGRTGLPEFTQAERDRLRLYLENGGFVLFDDASGVADSAFFQTVTDLLEKIFPDKRLVPLPADHVIFQSFYLLKEVSGRKIVKPFLYGIDLESLTPAIVCVNDLGGAWDGDETGYTYPCTPGGERQREMAFRLGVNLVMYSLTGTYKKDQVHIPFILKRRKQVP